MRMILSAVMGAALALSALPAAAQTRPAEKQIQLVIEARTLADALDEWAAQTGLQFFSKNLEIAKRLPAPHLNGLYSAQEALEKLLADSPLTYVWGDGKVTIQEREASSSEDRQAAAKPEQTSEAQQRPRSWRIAAADAPAQARWRAQGDSNPGRQSDAVREEVVVAGSRLKRDPATADVVTFDRNRIEQLGVTSVADILDYLPQQSFAQHDGTTFGGARAIRLRGLGFGTTLVLINGRRTVTSALQWSRNYFDLNTIPLSMVERVEVISNSASAVYGADAVGGVVNVVLKQNIDRPTATLYYGSADGGADEKRASLALGHVGDRLRIALSGDFYDRGFLLGEERDLSADQDFRRFGSIDRRVPTANPGNVTSRTPANLPGLPTRFAAIPPGSSGVGMTPANFLSTAGTRNLESIRRHSSLVPDSERVSALGLAEFDITERNTAFLELMYSTNENSQALFPAVLVNATVPATNPYNPFGTTVGVDYLFEGIDSITQVTDSKFWRGVAGVRGELGSWDWEISFLGIDDEADTWTENNVDMARVAAALTATDPAQALNLFRDGPPGSEALLRSLLSPPVINRNTSVAHQSSAFVRGALFQLPAGAVDVVLGGERREEKLHFESLPVTRVSTDRWTSAGYAELRAPLLRGMTFARDLSVTLAGRYDDYSDFGGTFNPQYGIEWAPVSWLLLRGSYGSSFRPPSLSQLYSPVTSATLNVTDPSRGVTGPVTVSQGGNPDLEPEESDTRTFGFLLRFQDLARLQFGATYWDIDQDERVQTLNVNVMLANESLFPGRLVRAAPTPTDVAAGRPGALQNIDVTTVNFGALQTSGVDVQLSASFMTSLGTFSPSLLATWVRGFESSDVPGAPAVERVARANPGDGSIPRWRASGTLAWNRPGVTLAATARYLTSYDDTAPGGVLNGRTISSTVLTDVQAALDLGEWGSRWDWLEGLVIRAGAVNVFDEEPDFSEVAGVAGYDSSQGDVRQRFGYLSISKTF
jgi:iron complex outermembrane receptor protein